MKTGERVTTEQTSGVRKSENAYEEMHIQQVELLRPAQQFLFFYSGVPCQGCEPSLSSGCRALMARRDKVACHR